MVYKRRFTDEPPFWERRNPTMKRIVAFFMSVILIASTLVQNVSAEDTLEKKRE